MMFATPSRSVSLHFLTFLAFLLSSLSFITAEKFSPYFISADDPDGISNVYSGNGNINNGDIGNSDGYDTEPATPFAPLRFFYVPRNAPSAVELSLPWEPMFPDESEETQPMLMVLYKATHDFGDKAPVDAEWAIFMGGPPNTRCTMEATGDYNPKNFFRENEVKRDIKGADRIWCRAQWP